MRIALLAACVAAGLSAPALAGPPPWANDRFDRRAERAYAQGFRDGQRAERWDDRRWSRADRAWQAGYRDGWRWGDRRDRRDDRWDNRWDNRRANRWEDRRAYCQRVDRGNGGLAAGALLGGVLGSEIARGDRTAGALVGATAGGLIGRSIDRRDGRC
jgi:hypothetical protein